MGFEVDEDECQACGRDIEQGPPRRRVVAVEVVEEMGSAMRSEVVGPEASIHADCVVPAGSRLH